MWLEVPTGSFHFNFHATMSLPRTLVIVETDPRSSSRPAEGIRIAAGIGAWKKTEVTLLLRGPAGYSLQEYADDLVDEDNFVRYLPIVAESPRPIYVEDSFGDFKALEGSAFRYEKISSAGTAQLICENDYLIRL
jgi:hypothetical protein